MLIGMVQATMILLVAQLWFRIPFAGSFVTLYVGLGLFLLAAVGIGLLVSSFAATMQQAMLYSFVLMMPFILLSGLTTPAQQHAREHPVFHADQSAALRDRNRPSRLSGRGRPGDADSGPVAAGADRDGDVVAFFMVVPASASIECFSVLTAGRIGGYSGPRQKPLHKNAHPVKLNCTISATVL